MAERFECPACSKMLVEATKINQQAEVRILCSCGCRTWLVNSMVGGVPKPYLREDPSIIHPSRLDVNNPRESVIKIRSMQDALGKQMNRIAEFLDILNDWFPTFAEPLKGKQVREKQVATLMEDPAAARRALEKVLSGLTDEERADILHS